jgi:tyrosinase
MKTTRRRLIAGSLALSVADAIPFAKWLCAMPSPGPGLIRYSAASPQGQNMLKIYASAVTAMKSIDKTSPLNWVFQWYTHCVPNDSGGPDPATKNQAMNDTFGPNPSSAKSIANDMWNTCQPHGGQRESFFLPWHRMYIYFFERIVRKVSGHPEFTLPYWDYTVMGAPHGVIPTAFGVAPLLQTNRNAGVNSGTAIDQNQRSKLNNDSLKQTAYEQTADTVLGFCADLDFNLHGQVHVYTGDTSNMGAVPWAANDPIFWAHHSNIDRFWASWNASGGLNPNDPAFLSQTFIFADELGNKIVAKVSDFLTTESLGYKYDQLLSKPPGFVPQQHAARTALTSVLDKTPPPQLTRPVEVRLGSSPVSVPLAPPEAKMNLRESLASTGVKKRLYLVARDISVLLQPGVVYNVSVGEDATPVGSINFFSLGHHHKGQTSNSFWSVDVTDRAKVVTAQAKPGESVNAVFTPSGMARDGASVRIGSISLIAL